MENSEMINGLTRKYEDAVKATQDDMNKLTVYNNEIIKREREKLLKNLDVITADYNKTFNNIVQQFINEHTIKLPYDGEDHTAHIANALKVIDTLGYGLDVNNLNNIIAPMVKDFKSVKTVCDVILAKNNNTFAASEIGYKEDVIAAVLDYSGVNSGISEYAERINVLKNTNNGIANYKYTVTYSGNYTENGYTALAFLNSDVSYNVIAVPTLMNEAAKVYREITNSEFFRQ